MTDNTFITHSEGETLDFGRRLSVMLSPGDSVLLYGDLGAGKSVLARGIARGLGVEDPMPSPTFTLLIPYTGSKGARVYHFDLYRISDPEEYYAAGLHEFVGGDGVAIIEWPQMADLAPEPALDIHLTRTGDDERLIEIENYGVKKYNPEALYNAYA